MKNFSFLIVLLAVGMLMESCSTMFSSAGNGNVMNDSTFTHRSIVGTSNTPGSTRIIDYQELKLGTGATPNTSGPSMSAQELAAYEKSDVNKINGVSIVDMKRFIQLATFNRLTEIQLSSIVSSKTKNKEISNYALKLIKDQNSIAEELNSIILSRKLAVEDLTGKADDDLSRKIDQLNQASAEQSDEMYIKLVKKEHRSAIQILEQGAKFKDTQISNFSSKYLPLFRAQLKSLESL